jgi:hypothetical protein
VFSDYRTRLSDKEGPSIVVVSFHDEQRHRKRKHTMLIAQTKRYRCDQKRKYGCIVTICCLSDTKGYERISYVQAG